MTEPMWRIRRAQLGDAAAIHDLTHAAYAKWVPLLGRAPKPMSADYDLAVRDHLIDLLFVGPARGELAALIEMIPRSNHLLIENLAVSPDFQSGGYGRHLMAHAEDVARALGHHLVRLYTNKLFAANLRFYQRLGYQLDREEPFKGGFLVHFSKNLASPSPGSGG